MDGRTNRPGKEGGEAANEAARDGEEEGVVASVPVLRASRGTLGQPCSDEKNYQK